MAAPLRAAVRLLPTFAAVALLPESAQANRLSRAEPQPHRRHGPSVRRHRPDGDGAHDHQHYGPASAATALLEEGSGFSPRRLVGPVLAAAGAAAYSPATPAMRHAAGGRLKKVSPSAAGGRREGLQAHKDGDAEGGFEGPLRMKIAKADVKGGLHPHPPYSPPPPKFWEDQEDGPNGDYTTEEVPARNRLALITGAGEDPWTSIHLPADWSYRFKPGTIEAHPQLEHNSNPEMVGSARFSHGGEEEVKFAFWKADDPRTTRHIRISQMLSSSGLVPPIYEVRHFPETTYLLQESPGTFTLASLMSQYETAWTGSAHHPRVPLKVALPLMIDLLRGAEVMERYNIVHGDLHEHNIYVVDKDGHTLLDDFGSACVVGGDADVACDGMTSELCGSAFRHPPEMVDGVPRQPSNNVWQLGMVLAKLFLGHVVPTDVKNRFDDSDPEERADIREFMRKHFSIYDNVVFQALYEEYWDILGIVAGMLEKDPEHRWTAHQALTEAMDVAGSRGIEWEWYPEDFPSKWTESSLP